MNLTIIAYRPNDEDYCRGCRMGSSDSDHEIYEPYNTVEAVDIISKILLEDKKSDLEYAETEITILFDGRESSNPSTDSIEAQITIDAAFVAKKLFNHYQIQLEEKKLAAKIKADEDKKARDIETLKNLQKQFPDV